MYHIAHSLKSIVHYIRPNWVLRWIHNGATDRFGVGYRVWRTTSCCAVEIRRCHCENEGHEEQGRNREGHRIEIHVLEFDEVLFLCWKLEKEVGGKSRVSKIWKGWLLLTITASTTSFCASPSRFSCPSHFPPGSSRFRAVCGFCHSPSSVLNGLHLFSIFRVSIHSCSSHLQLFLLAATGQLSTGAQYSSFPFFVPRFPSLVFLPSLFSCTPWFFHALLSSSCVP